MSIRPFLPSLIAGSFFSGFIVTSAQAQVIPDNSLGTTVTGNPNFIINGGPRPSNGPNLFHSFSQFSVPTGGSASFNNAPDVVNIFSRITGGRASNIDGILRANGSANVFLLNPAGIIFGPNAQLNIGGSLIGTTASSIKFADGSEFSATPAAAPPLLTISVPLGLQMGSGTIPPNANITNRGSLTTGQDLILVADQLDIQGQLQAGRDLTLAAQTTVQMRDSLATPLITTAGRNLTIQGNQGIDILALSNPRTQIQSGGNLRLISNGEISGDAHWLAGGGLFMQTLAGTPGTFVSKFDPIIYANGDVVFGDYTGVALKVEATGSIEAGNLQITGPDTAVPITDPDFAILTSQPAVILRAGVASVPAPNLPQFGIGDLPTDFNAGTVTSGQLPGSITVGNIDTSNSVGGDGGAIILNAIGDVTVNGNLSSSASLFGGEIVVRGARFL
jgi:filamentous hemagglutinin family protein